MNWKKRFSCEFCVGDKVDTGYNKYYVLAISNDCKKIQVKHVDGTTFNDKWYSISYFKKVVE